MRVLCGHAINQAEAESFRSLEEEWALSDRGAQYPCQNVCNFNVPV